MAGLVPRRRPARRPSARTDDRGRFAIEGLASGTTPVAIRGDGYGLWRDEVEIEAQATTTIAPQLLACAILTGTVTDGAGLPLADATIRGIVLFGDGHPMPHVFVTLTDERSGRQHVQTNDKDGVFRFLCLDASTHGVRVQYWDAPKGTPALQQSGLVPDRGRVELRAPFDRPVKELDGIVIGRVDDVARRIKNPQAVTVTLHSDANWFRNGGKIVEGVFRFERVTPCRFRLALQEDANVLAQSDWFELQPAATMDTGVLRTVPGGSAKVYLTRQAGTQAFEPKLYLRRGSFGDSTVVDVGRNVEVVADNLTPGEYEVTGYATGLVSLRGHVSCLQHHFAALGRGAPGYSGGMDYVVLAIPARKCRRCGVLSLMGAPS